MILMQKVRKYLVYEYVPIIEKTFRSGIRENCVAQRSIYVILRGNEETRSYINQVRRKLLSEYMSVYKYKTRNFKFLVSFYILGDHPQKQFVSQVENYRSYNFKYFHIKFSAI
jgi:hypothetical protein